MKKPFDDCSYLSQVRQLRHLATSVLKQYPLRNYELKFINHGENTTYKVMTKKKNYLLRIHCRSHRTKNAMLEELKWLKALADKTNIPVQRPLLSKKKELLISLGEQEIGQSRYCDILEWQEGHIKYKKSPETFLEVGKLIGCLQKNTMKSRYRPYWDTEGLVGRKATLGPISALDNDFPRYSTRLENLRKQLFKKIKSYEKKNGHRLSLIHGDLHFGNMIWNKDEVRPIDFDDCGYGLEIYDLAVTLAQSRNLFKEIGKKRSSQYKDALLEGYAYYKPLTKSDIEILPYLVAARGLLLIGWLYDRSDNPFLRDYLKKNLATRVKETTYYLELAEKGTYLNT